MTKVTPIMLFTFELVIFRHFFLEHEEASVGQPIVAHVELRTPVKFLMTIWRCMIPKLERARFRGGQARLSTQYGNILTIKLDRAAKGLLISAPNERVSRKS